MAEQNLSARALSRRAGLGESTAGQMLREWETKAGYSPDSSTLAAVAAALGTTVSYLLGDSEEKPEVHMAPRFGEMPEWPMLREAARALDATLPEWTFDKVAASYPMPTAPMIPMHVVELARLALKLTSPPTGALPKAART